MKDQSDESQIKIEVEKIRLRSVNRLKRLVKLRFVRREMSQLTAQLVFSICFFLRLNITQFDDENNCRYAGHKKILV